MKAYKIIFELLKHPFADVTLLLKHKDIEVIYNQYCKDFDISPIPKNKK